MTHKLVEFDRDSFGAAMIYIGDHTVYVPNYWHKCPVCDGWSEPWEYEECWLCGDSSDWFTPWHYWRLRARRAFWGAWDRFLSPVLIWWHSRTEVEEE